MVVSDNAGGAAAATEHCSRADTGGSASSATSCASTRPPSGSAATARRSRATASRPRTPTLVRTELRDGAAAGEAVAELLALPDPPTALLTAQNVITVGAIRRLRALDRHHAVAMVGFDDLELADALEPALSVMAQDAPALGRAAAELLFARLDGVDGGYRRIEVPTTLIARGSGELAP